LNERELKELATVVEGADCAIIITEKDGVVSLGFSQHLNDMEVLDLLAVVTSTFYDIAEEDGSDLVH
jgi:hypothetical protein